MKAIENTLYSVEKHISGKLIGSDGTLNEAEATTVTLTEEEGRDIVSILEDNVSIDSHLCITAYRDAIVVNATTYNICLSCGDFYKGNEHFYLSGEGIAKFRKLKSKFQIVRSSTVINHKC
jgi:hypothetical protein